MQWKGYEYNRQIDKGKKDWICGESEVRWKVQKDTNYEWFYSMNSNFWSHRAHLMLCSDFAFWQTYALIQIILYIWNWGWNRSIVMASGHLIKNLTLIWCSIDAQQSNIILISSVKNLQSKWNETCENWHMIWIWFEI